MSDLPRLCMACGETLTAEERHYYGETCNRCEVEKHERIATWMSGAKDEELDRMFSAPKPVLH